MYGPPGRPGRGGRRTTWLRPRAGRRAERVSPGRADAGIDGELPGGDGTGGRRLTGQPQRGEPPLDRVGPVTRPEDPPRTAAARTDQDLERKHPAQERRPGPAARDRRRRPRVGRGRRRHNGRSPTGPRGEDPVIRQQRAPRWRNQDGQAFEQLQRIPMSMFTFTRCSSTACIRARRRPAGHASTSWRPPPMPISRGSSRGSTAACGGPPWPAAGRRRRERPVRARGAAVRERRGGVAPGPGRPRAARRTAGASPPVGGRRDGDRDALRPAGRLQPARGRRGAGAPAGPAGKGVPLHLAPGAGRGAVDGEPGRAATLPLPTAMARRLHGACARSACRRPITKTWSGKTMSDRCGMTGLNHVAPQPRRKDRQPPRLPVDPLSNARV